MILATEKLTFTKDIEKTILRIADERGVTPEDVIVEFVKKQIAWAQFQEMQKELAPKLQADGWTEDRALNEIS